MPTVLVNSGKEWIVEKINDNLQNTNEFIAWGTGEGEADEEDTELFEEASEDRVMATRISYDNKVRWIGTIPADGEKTITNTGVFTEEGDLIIKADFEGVLVHETDEIQFTIEMEIV